MLVYSDFRAISCSIVLVKIEYLFLSITITRLTWKVLTSPYQCLFDRLYTYLELLCTSLCCFIVVVWIILELLINIRCLGVSPYYMYIASTDVILYLTAIIFPTTLLGNCYVSNLWMFELNSFLRKWFSSRRTHFSSSISAGFWHTQQKQPRETSWFREIVSSEGTSEMKCNIWIRGSSSFFPFE